MSQDAGKKKDVWEKLDIIAKGILAIAVSGGVAFYSTSVQTKLHDEKEKSLRAQTLIQMVNSRETASANLRTRMFETLLQNYFSGNQTEEQIVALEMIGLNFRDTMQIKPMFELLDRRLSEKIAEEPDNLLHQKRRAQLIKAARAIVRDQLTQIRLSEEGEVCNITLNLSDNEPSYPDCFYSYAFKLVRTDYGSVRIQPYMAPEIDLTQTDEDSINQSMQWLPAGKSFHINYFDTPMLDYSIVAGDKWHYSLVLLEVENGQAEIAVAVLPTTNFAARNSYRFDEMLGEYIYINTAADGS